MYLLFAALAAAQPTVMERIDVPARTHRPVTIVHTPVAVSGADHGRSGDAPLRLPEQPPALTVNGSRFSPLFRARDVFDVARWPARTVAKLFRFDPAGARTNTACTAQFVGPRYLVTAGHCVVDPSTGQPYAAFEVAVRFDAGKSAGGTAKVTAAWVAPRLLRPATTAADALVTPDRCDDVAVLAIDQPLGTATGWLAMRDRAPVTEPDPRMLYRFAYPQQSNAAALAAARARPGLPDAAKATLDAMIEKARTSEPDFSPDNLYFDYGRADLAEGRFIAERTGYGLPGRSGGALLDGNGSIVAILSRGYGGASYSCRLDADTIGTLAAIVAGGGD